MISPLHAALLGVVEGLTEFLPVSSTGHLILASHWLGLHGEGVKTFQVVIQAGALVAVAGRYRRRILSMGRGLLGRDAAGRALLSCLAVSVLPAAIAGAALHAPIKRWLFATGPVVAALAVGGAAMIGVDRWVRRAGPRAPRTLETIRLDEALVIGLAQCAALWPGTSRAMVTIVAGLLLGWPATTAAEYSFLLALPTLGAATLFDASTGTRALLDQAGWGAVMVGFLAAAGVAALAMRAFVAYLTRRGLAPFGWYRLAAAGALWWLMGRS